MKYVVLIDEKCFWSKLYIDKESGSVTKAGVCVCGGGNGIYTLPG